jgi:2,4-dienoyl-CoA reductase [(3E)-enoyl-CoA-producing], peroxisomal
MSYFRNDLLKNKVAFITGGGSGICKGIARAMIQHGAKVAIVGRNEDRLQTASQELSAEHPGHCMPCAADVREPNTIEAAIDRCMAELGPVDIVVNGAAGNFLAPAAALSYNAFRTVMAIDALGTYNVSRAAFDRSLRERGGNILNISATLHYGATPLQVHAAAAKAAVDAQTRTLAVEWGPLGIRINGIAPGPIAETEGMKRLAPSPEATEALTRRIPLGRFGRIDEIAQLALFLVSDAASLVHGETVVADGGAWLGNKALF